MRRGIATALVLGTLATAGVIAVALSQVGPPASSNEPKPGIPSAQQKSGTAFLSAATRAQHEDLTVNPGMLWVERGTEIWQRSEGKAQRACASCHGEVEGLKGVATRYPRWDDKARRVHSIETRIQECRTERQQGVPLQEESAELLALSAVVTHQSHGMPVSPSIDGPARAAFDLGERLYRERVGQLNLNCAQCHEDNWGRRLRSETISQGQSNGYPIYRLEWQTLGSLHRRLRSCYLSVRSEPPAHGSQEHMALELYLAWRAKGLPVEAPAVRR